MPMSFTDPILARVLLSLIGSSVIEKNYVTMSADAGRSLWSHLRKDDTSQPPGLISNNGRRGKKSDRPVCNCASLAPHTGPIASCSPVGRAEILGHS